MPRGWIHEAPINITVLSQEGWWRNSLIGVHLCCNVLERVKGAAFSTLPRDGIGGGGGHLICYLACLSSGSGVRREEKGGRKGGGGGGEGVEVI